MRFYELMVLSFVGIALLGSCTAKLPSEYDEKDELPKIYPDYVDVTIPVNIAPLTFELDEEADGMIARYKAGDIEIICADKMQPDLDDWRELIATALHPQPSTLDPFRSMSSLAMVTYGPTIVRSPSPSRPIVSTLGSATASSRLPTSVTRRSRSISAAWRTTMRASSMTICSVASRSMDSASTATTTNSTTQRACSSMHDRTKGAPSSPTTDI